MHIHPLSPSLIRSCSEPLSHVHTWRDVVYIAMSWLMEIWKLHGCDNLDSSSSARNSCSYSIATKILSKKLVNIVGTWLLVTPNECTFQLGRPHNQTLKANLGHCLVKGAWGWSMKGGDPWKRLFFQTRCLKSNKFPHEHWAKWYEGLMPVMQGRGYGYS